MAALLLALYGVATAVLEANTHWYSYFAIGAYICFASLNKALHGRTTLGLKPRAKLRQFLRLYGLFFLTGAAIDLLYGRHIGGAWVHPGFSQIDQVLHVLLLGFPFAFFSVLETYFLLAYAVEELLPETPIAPHASRPRSVLLLVIGAVSLALPLALPYANSQALIHEVLFFCMLGSLLFFDAINSLIGRTSVFDRLLARDWHLFLSIVLTSVLTGLAHEIPNTYAREWVHQNIPFTSLEVLGVNVLVLTAGWCFLTLLPITLYHLLTPHSQQTPLAPCQVDTDRVSFLEWPANAIGLHYTIFWPSVGLLLPLGHFLIVRALGLPESQPTVLLLTGLIFAWICVEIVWAEHALRNLTPLLCRLTPPAARAEISSWYQKHISFAFEPSKLLAMGVLGLFIGLVVPVASKLPFWHNAPIVVTYDLFLCIVVGIVGMMSQWCFYGIATTIRGLARFPIRPGFFGHANDSLQAVSSVLLKIWLGGIGLILLVELIFFSLGLGDSLLLQIFVGTATLGAVFWFYLVHSRLHVLMVAEKRKRLDQLSNQIEEILDLMSVGYRSSLVSRLRLLTGMHRELSNLPEWPFDTAMLVRFVTASVSPLATLALQRAFGT